jgi:hemolysin-activating ACP:hemolysin acyltransferase
MFSRKSGAPERAQGAAAVEQKTAERAATAGGSAASATPKSPSAEETQRRAIADARLSIGFARIVSVLMRSPLHKHFSLADLEWLVLPPLLTGQCHVVEAKAQPNAAGVPVAVVFWASVSPEVDKRLSENLNAPIRLRPDEWKSGEILWLVDAVGDARVVTAVLKQLNEGALKGKQVKMRARGQDGKLLQRTLAAELAALPKAAN